MRRRRISTAAAAAMLVCAAPIAARAQSILPFAVEGRGGLAFPTTEGLKDDYDVGYELGGTAKLSLLPMLRIYGHSWPVRWGKTGEKRPVNVYSNCDEVELWLNGVFQGRRQRDSQNFPAAGLRWNIVFDEGMNTLRAVGTKNGTTVSDETVLRYETRRWGKPHHLRLQELPSSNGRTRVQAELLDEAGVVCLDARDFIRFGHAGDGRLLDNLGTARGSRFVQLANGRAQIDLLLPEGGQAMLGARQARQVRS